jgi:hypothetical protein
MGGAATMALLLGSGCLLIWRRPQSSVGRAIALAGLAYLGVLGIRVLASDGAELAGRLLTYAYLFAALPVAVALVALGQRRRRWGPALALGAVALVFTGNAASGWPAPYETVPGRFHVAGFESGVDPAGVAAARWIAANAPADATVACDFKACSLVGGSGPQRPLDNAPRVFTATALDARTRALIQHDDIDFVLVDRRMARQRPVTGSFFAHGGGPSEPLPAGALAKFDGAPGVARVYDAGPIAIYDVRRLRAG